jgi:hypothetical protein
MRFVTQKTIFLSKKQSMKNIKHFLSILAVLLYFVSCSDKKPTIKTTKWPNVQKVNLSAARELLISQKEKIFIGSDQCNGSILTYQNVILEELNDYGNSIFYLGDEDNLIKHYLHDSVQIFWIETYFNNSLTHKNKIRQLVKSIDPDFNCPWILPLEGSWDGNSFIML